MGRERNRWTLSLVNTSLAQGQGPQHNSQTLLWRLPVQRHYSFLQGCFNMSVKMQWPMLKAKLTRELNPTPFPGVRSPRISRTPSSGPSVKTPSFPRYSRHVFHPHGLWLHIVSLYSYPTHPQKWTSPLWSHLLIENGAPRKPFQSRSQTTTTKDTSATSLEKPRSCRHYHFPTCFLSLNAKT